MNKNWLILPIAMWSGLGVAQTTQPGTPAVFLATVSDLDDPEMIRPARPVGAFRTWLEAADFAPQTFDPQTGQGVLIDVEINPDDTVASCVPQSALVDLAEHSCRIIRERGRFLHALDFAGKAQSGRILMSVSFSVFRPGQWRGPPPAPPSAGYRNADPVIRTAELLKLPAEPQIFTAPHPTAWLGINDKGRVTQCRIRTSTGTDTGDAALCRQIARARFEPARNPQGKRVSAQSHFVQFETAQ